MDSTKLLEDFPCLIPSLDLKFWNGTLLFENEEIAVSISTPCFPSLRNFSLMSPISVKKHVELKLKRFKKLVREEDAELLQLLQYLKNNDSEMDKAKSLGSNIPDDSLLMKMDYYLYNKILRELRQLSGENIVACSSDLMEITLRTPDIEGQDHKLIVSLPNDYPNRRPVVLDVDLPQVAITELCQANSLVEIFKIFQSLVESFQTFWNTYKHITKNTWFIDPEHPTFKDTHCRIIIGDNVSMLITLNPKDVNTCPDIKFLGPETAVTPFINSMERKLKTDGWDEDSSVLDNLLSLLNLSQFPLPDHESELCQQGGECSICFILRLDDQTLPTKVCNNTKCDSNFHISCLAQWFQAVPTNETSFNLISGDCPCCGEAKRVFNRTTPTYRSM